MKPQEMIDVIQAYIDGKQIQMCEWLKTDWNDCKLLSPMFDFCHYEYRVKPAALRPHWPALLECRGIDYQVVGDTLFATEADARKYYNPPSVKVIRLATEYPPVMLP